MGCGFWSMVKRGNEGKVFGPQLKIIMKYILI